MFFYYFLFLRYRNPSVMKEVNLLVGLTRAPSSNQNNLPPSLKVAFVQVEDQVPHFGSLNQFSSLNPSSVHREGHLKRRYRSNADALSVPGIVAMWSLAVLSFERFFVICRPLGNMRLQAKHAAIGLLFVWTFSFVWTFPPVLGWNRYTVSKIGTTCEPDW